MGYSVVIDKDIIEVHCDMCEELFKRKEEISFKNLEFINFNLFDEVKDFIKEKEVVFCDVCNPQTKECDEEWDDFYEEFDEDEEIDNSRCEI